MPLSFDATHPSSPSSTLETFKLRKHPQGQGEGNANFLDMAKKKRNTEPARGEPCPQFFRNRFRALPRGGAPFDATQHNSFLSALLNQSPKPAPLPRVKPA